MKRILFLTFAAAAIISCQTEVDKKLKPITQFDKFLHPDIKPDSIPDSLSTHLYNFATTFPQHNRSENYLYAATLIAERTNRPFECAKWCEIFTQHYPKSKRRPDALVAAAHNFEKTGVYDKAIKFYELAAKEHPDANIRSQSAATLEMLNKGLLTPEQQFEYIQGKLKTDSTNRN